MHTSLAFSDLGWVGVQMLTKKFVLRFHLYFHLLAKFSWESTGHILHCQLEDRWQELERTGHLLSYVRLRNDATNISLPFESRLRNYLSSNCILNSKTELCTADAEISKLHYEKNENKLAILFIVPVF